MTIPTKHAAARYFAVDPTGNDHTFSAQDPIPIPFRSAIAVHLGSKTPHSPDGRVYVANLLESDGPTMDVRLMSAAEIQRRSTAGFAAYDLANQTNELATESAERLAPPPEAKSQSKSKRRKRATGARKSGTGIQVVDLDVGKRPSRKVGRAKQSVSSGKKTGSKKPVAPWGWKSVDIFVTPWCGACTRAKKWMRANGVAFQEFNLDSDAQASRRRSKLVKRSGKGNGLPTIVIGREERVMVGWSPSRFTRLAAK